MSCVVCVFVAGVVVVGCDLFVCVCVVVVFSPRVSVM